VLGPAVQAGDADDELCGLCIGWAAARIRELLDALRVDIKASRGCVASLAPESCSSMLGDTPCLCTAFQASSNMFSPISSATRSTVRTRPIGVRAYSRRSAAAYLQSAGGEPIFASKWLDQRHEDQGHRS
jgi:hypothetical protein